MESNSLKKVRGLQEVLEELKSSAVFSEILQTSELSDIVLSIWYSYKFR